MKKLFYLVIFSMLIISCKKDPCDNVHCLNGGQCVDGTCNCPGGYSGPNCENYDPCYGIDCLHGGTCVNGICDCPEGYSGPDCGNVQTPTSVKVTKVVVNNFPQTDNGAGWDPFDGPDVFLTINSGTTINQNGYVSANYFEDSFAPLTFSDSDNLLMTMATPSNNYTIAVWDYDSYDPDDIIGGIYFKPTDYDGGFPSTIVLESGSFKFTITVDWQF